eukprot:scaffold181813_cov32-Tisochrysis_lutea.AAC.2
MQAEPEAPARSPPPPPIPLSALCSLCLFPSRSLVGTYHILTRRAGFLRGGGGERREECERM